MSDLVNLQGVGKQVGQGQEPEMAPSEGGCCLPFFPECGPDTCGLPLPDERSAGQRDHPPRLLKKVVKLTREGAHRLFNGDDDEDLFTRRPH